MILAWFYYVLIFFGSRFKFIVLSKVIIKVVYLSKTIPFRFYIEIQRFQSLVIIYYIYILLYNKITVHLI